MIVVVFMCICKIMPIINTKTSHKKDFLKITLYLVFCLL